MFDAPLSGGFSPGARRYAVDGNFDNAWPCAAPEVYCPFDGDSGPSVYPIVLLDRSIAPPDFALVNIGTGFNIQPLNPNQSAIVIEQEFMVAAEANYQLPLNTLYDPAWSVGWGNAYQNLENCFLVEESALVPIGGGIARFKRKFANLPANRNDYESYSATFPALDYGSDTNKRFGFSRIVNSRIFREFFVFDDLDLLPLALYPAGHRINTGTASSYPVMWEQFQGFAADANAVANYQLLDPDAALADDTGSGATHPSYSTYKGWQGAAEIVAESSCFQRWLGNIFVRKTRFVLAL